MRYTAYLHHEDDLENGECRHRWTHFVSDRVLDTVGPKFTEAEASIIAFALNAIADGHQLLYGDVDDDRGVMYVGPTDGVAPQ